MAKKKTIIGKVEEGLAESTRTVHEINKENFAAVRSDAKENNPELYKFLHTKGIGSKAKLVVDDIKEGAAEAAKKERERRTEIQSHEGYRIMLEKQREAQQKAIDRTGK